jgi:carbonic anhydrase
MKTILFTQLFLVGTFFTQTPTSLGEIPAESSSTKLTVSTTRHNEALKSIRQGNLRFLQNLEESKTFSLSNLQNLANAQKPHTIILACSDSRVPPEIVFNQEIGSVFTVRTAGMSLDSNVIGSLEYAIKHLHSKNLVILGHTSCGAVKATLDLLDNKNPSDKVSPALQELLSDLKPRLEKFQGKPRTPQLLQESTANTQGILRDLVERSSLIREEYQTEILKITPAIYSLENGTVTFF